MGKIVLALVIAASACAPRGRARPEMIVCGPGDEAAVWGVALATEVTPYVHPKSVVLVVPTTLGLLRPEPREITEPFRAKNVEVPAALIARFFEANRSPADLSQACKPNRHVGTTTSTEQAELFRGADPYAGWAAFYKKYNGAVGLFRLSRPGIHGDLALMHVEFSCDPECGHGHLYLLRRVGGTWTVVARAVTWLS